MDEARVHQIIRANDDDLLKKMSDLISSHVSAFVKRPADDSVARRKKIKTAILTHTHAPVKRLIPRATRLKTT